MKKFTLFIVLFLLTTLTFAQQNDRSPYKSEIPSGPIIPTDATFDVQFNYTIGNTVGLGNAGAEFDGNFIWVAKWASNKFYRFTKTGAVRDSFVVSGYTGASNVRDLAFDGRYIYGGAAAGNTIVRIDTGSLSVVKTITTTVASIRAIAWDPVLKGFWVCGWNDAIICVDTNGVAIAGKSIANTYAGKYGLAYDSYSLGGPFLWVFDQTVSAGGTGQTIYKYDLNTLTYTGVSLDVTTKITNAGTAAIAGGLFITNKIVPGYATIGGIMQGTPDVLFGLELAVTDAGPLQPFNLQTPAAGVTVTSIPGSSTPITITWDTSRAAATYKWIFGTALPARLYTISAGTNMITMSLGQLDVILAGLGLAQGDSISGQWDVWAFRNNPPQNDSLKSANGPRAIKFKRQKPVLSTFNLLNPPTGTTVSVANGGTAPVNINWSKSGAGVTYKWFYATPNFSTPSNIKLRIASDNSGLDSTLSLTTGQIDAAISGFVNVGDSTVGQWRVYAYSGADSLASTQTFNITFKRLPIITIGNGTTSSNFPFTTYWKDGRTQFLYLGSELNSPSGYISQIGFDVLSVGGPAMTDFKVSFKTTTLTSLSTFENGGFTVGYNPASYAPSGTGWNMITLTTPYYYLTGTNLIVDICYNNTTYTAYSTTASTAAPGMYYGRYNDLTDPLGGCDYTAWTLTTGPAGRSNTRFLINPGPVGINDPVTNTIPVVYNLSQNYPNPFNPVTKINFDIPKQGLVTLKIYDMLGREVKSLVNEVKQAGRYTVDFNASEFASGVYFYKLEAGTYRDVKKMMLIK